MLGLFTHLTRRLGMGYLCSNIDIWEGKKEINRNFKFGKSTEKRGFYVHVSKTDRFFLSILTPPPQHLPKFLPSGAWEPGETKMALYNGALVQLTSNVSTDSARTQLGLSVQ